MEPGFATIEPLTDKSQAQHAQLLAAAQQQQQQQLLQSASANTASRVSQQPDSKKTAPGLTHVTDHEASAQGSKTQQASAGKDNSSEQTGSDQAPPSAKPSAVAQVLQMVATVLHVLVSREEEPLPGPKGA